MLNAHKTELSSGGLRSMRYVKKSLPFAMLALLLMPISVRDISNRSLLRMQLTHAANSAVLAGAAYLPGQPQKASQVAKNYAALNGVVSSELVSIETAQDGHSISMIVQRSAAPLLGLTLGSIRVTASAQAHSARNRRSAELNPANYHPATLSRWIIRLVDKAPRRKMTRATLTAAAWSICSPSGNRRRPGAAINTGPSLAPLRKSH
jgi:hypothetical protein